MELDLELVAEIRVNDADAKRESFDDVVNGSKVVFLIVPGVDLEGSHPRRVVYGGVLELANAAAVYNSTPCF